MAAKVRTSYFVMHKLRARPPFGPCVPSLRNCSTPCFQLSRPCETASSRVRPEFRLTVDRRSHQDWLRFQRTRRKREPRWKRVRNPPEKQARISRIAKHIHPQETPRGHGTSRCTVSRPSQAAENTVNFRPSYLVYILRFRFVVKFVFSPRLLHH